MAARTYISDDQFRIRVKVNPLAARRQRPRHGVWKSRLLATLCLLSPVLIACAVYYFVSNPKTQNVSTTHSHSSTAELASVSRKDPGVLVAARESISPSSRRPSLERGPTVIAFPAESDIDPAVQTSYAFASYPDITPSQSTEHWTAFDPLLHAGLYESPVSVQQQNLIDEIVFADLRNHQLQPARLCSDETFLRRVYLDVLGTLPSAVQSREFIANPLPNKRNALIEHVLQQPEFADYWAMKWCDVLRVKAEFPINLWPQAAQAYHHWIRTALANNVPYDKFVYELLTSSGSNFRAPQVNFYRALQSQEPKAITQVVALTFMGERTENWPAEQLDGVSQFFSRVGYKPTGEWKEEIVFFDRRRHGQVSSDIVKAVYPSGVTVDIPADQDPRRVFADWLIDDHNPRFATAFVNRVWCWLIGRGIIEPVDDLRGENRATNSRLLDHLAHELIASQYDVKHLIRVILQSSTYQQSCISVSKEIEAAEHFAFYQPRRLDAEVLIDAICQITGTTETYMSIIPEPFTFLPETQRAIALPDGSITSSFLETFGRPSRDTGLASERNNRLSPGQALHLLNSNHIRDKLRRGTGMEDLIRQSSDRFGKVELLYLTILSRRPTDGELSIGGQLCGSTRGAQDLAWALINSDEFLFRH